MHLSNPFRRAALWAAGAAIVTCLVAPPASAELSLDKFTVIAGGWQLERRCGHLDAAERDDLGDIVARAEVDAANRHGVGAVRDVLHGAQKFGREEGANCGDETRQAVERAYSVARDYALELDAYPTYDTITNGTHTHSYEDDDDYGAPRRSRLERFGSQTEAYYLQLRCRHLPYETALEFWELIKKHHYALIRRYGTHAVGRVSRQAKHDAYSSSVYCGPKTWSMVWAGLYTIRGD